jgi:RNA polymerase sigma factor (sigma-70 family)
MTDGDRPREEGELRQFLARIRDGDEEAARELLRLYEAKVRLVVRRQLPRLLRSRFDSQDFVQSIWGSFFRRIKASPTELESTENLVGFLARAARNKESMWEGAEPRDLVDGSNSPSEVAEASEAFSRLRDLLPADRRNVLDLKAEGLTTVEIAAKLGIGERTVRRVIEDLRRRAGIDGAGEAT